MFKGLYLEKNWDWAETYPVISISFGGGVIADRRDLDKKIEFILSTIADDYGVSYRFEKVREKFNELILLLFRKFNRPVVILVDEYDKPILDNITETKKALEIREGLKNLYSVIKDCDAYVKFCFITGVSKFSKVSLFSGLNNLEDITLSPDFSTICGYSEKEMSNVFKTLISGMNADDIRRWYNGYNFQGESVYNPFDVLLYFKKGQFGNYWFESATPTFLIRLLKERRFYLPLLEDLQVGENILGSFDVDRLLPETLLFQTGYLTIKSTTRLGPRKVYTLGYPNLEVQLSFTDYLLDDYVLDIPAKSNAQSTLYRVLQAADLPSVRQTLESLFAAIPHDWYRKNNLDRYEGYYASVVYACFASLGFDLIAEDTNSHGRIDLTLFSENQIYIFEFKVIELFESSKAALHRIKEKNYHQKYLSENRDIYLIVIEFSRTQRNITAFDWEKIKQVSKFKNGVKGY